MIGGPGPGVVRPLVLSGPYSSRVVKRSWVLGLVLGLLLAVGAVAPAHAAPERAGTGYRCIVDAFGHTAGGRITLRRVVNTRVTLSKKTAQSFRWRPIAWGLVSAESLARSRDDPPAGRRDRRPDPPGGDPVGHR
ncbi:hypothetical protein G5V59_15310 [Nocardioides sp. W3-2-3]|uniref:hypothetical protein n=1 Tax=Nocardioides convexus TaxID=2712224 RepID=UPI002418B8C6|nr:hypothetical protein [Nocardioides convexus]NHA00832.1 hypothetical protein [Nocardioides convexus]